MMKGSNRCDFCVLISLTCFVVIITYLISSYISTSISIAEIANIIIGVFTLLIGYKIATSIKIREIHYTYVSKDMKSFFKAYYSFREGIISGKNVIEVTDFSDSQKRVLVSLRDIDALTQFLYKKRDIDKAICNLRENIKEIGDILTDSKTEGVTLKENTISYNNEVSEKVSEKIKEINSEVSTILRLITRVSI